MRAFRLLLTASLLLTGCALRMRDITLQNATGKRVVCGGDTMITPRQTEVAAELQRGCVRDFQRQGYERVSD
jgi:hypothetical protein